jgi:type I restriction enzyme S subunit
VKLLDEADELRKLRAQADRRIAALLPALFDEMFGDPATNPKGFPKEPLGDLIRVKSGDSLPAKDMDAAGKFAVYGGNGVSGYHGKFMFEQPVIVIGRVGVYCGAVHLSEPRSWVTDNALYVCELKKEFDLHYLVAALRLANFNQYAGRAAQPLVSGSRIYRVSILVPPLPLQKEFAQRVTEIRELEAGQAASRQRLEALFQSMLHRAFQGEL